MSITGRLAGPHPGHPNAWKVKAQDSADGSVRDHLHRSRHYLSLAVGRNREFSQGGQLRPDTQASVLLDLQVSQDFHHRFRCNPIASLIVEVEVGPDRMGPHIHEHHLGGDGKAPLAKCAKSRANSSTGPSGRWLNSTGTDPVNRLPRKLNCSRLDSWPNSSGISPVSWLLARNKFRSWDSWPNCCRDLACQLVVVESQRPQLGELAQLRWDQPRQLVVVES